MRIVVGSDHAGFELKQNLAAFLSQRGDEVFDAGTHSMVPVDYPDYAEAVARAVLEGRAERGVLICGSGIGAGNCMDTYSAHQGVEHDDMNVLVLGARVVGHELARELVKSFCGARFTGEERHMRRLAKIAAIEARYGTGRERAGKTDG